MLSYLPNKSDFHRSSFRYEQTLNSNIFSPTRLAINADFELTLDTLDILYLEKYERSLNAVEKLLLAGVWQQKTYSEIAKENNYSSDYFSNVAAPKLFKQLSKLVRCRVTKKNCRLLVTQHIVNLIED